MWKLFCGPPCPIAPHSQPLRAGEAFPPVCASPFSMLNFYSLNQKQTQHTDTAAHRSPGMHLAGTALVALFSPLSPKLMKISFPGFCNTNPHPPSSLPSHSPHRQTASMERWYTVWSHGYFDSSWVCSSAPSSRTEGPVLSSPELRPHDLYNTLGKVVGPHDL